MWSTVRGLGSARALGFPSVSARNPRFHMNETKETWRTTRDMGFSWHQWTANCSGQIFESVILDKTPASPRADCRTAQGTRLGSDSKNAKSLYLGWCVTQQKLTDTPSMAEFMSILSLCSVAKSCPTLCDPMCCAPLGSLVYGILQARRQEWVAISSSRVSSWPREWTQVSWLAGRFFTLSHQESPYPYKGLYPFLPQYLCPIWGHLLC